MSPVDTSPTLSIVIPAYNEEDRIGPTLDKIGTFIATRVPFSVEVIVVDDCSTDNTSAVAAAIVSGRPGFRLLRSERNTGKGGAVRLGMAAATGEFRLFTDADLSTPIEEVVGLLKIIQDSLGGRRPVDVVIGSRRVRGAHVMVRQPVYREAAGRLFSVLVRLLTLRGFIDTQCGFKLFSRKAAESVFPLQTIPGFGFDVEILFIARRLGFNIVEAPVTWYDSPLTRVRLFRDSASMFLDLLRIRFNAWRGRYGGC